MDQTIPNFQKQGPISGSKSNWLSTILIMLILAVAITVLSGFIGFGKQGFNITAILHQFTVYVGFGIGALFGILLLEIYFRTKGKDSETSTFFNSPRFKFKFLSNPFQLLLLSLIIFSIFGFITTVFNTNTFFLGIGTLQEQFTVVDGILYNWALVVTSENLGASLFAGLMVLFLYLAAEKWKFKGSNFKYLSILLFIVSFVIYGFVLHQLRYSQSEPDLLRVIIFWGIGGVITALSGSIIPFLALHGMNNTFVELASKYSQESTLIPIIIFIVGLILLYVFLFIRRKRKT